MSIAITIFSMLGIGGIISGIVLAVFKRWLDKRDKAAEFKERTRAEFELCLIESTTASMALAEATAKAVQRIPDAHCNGDMHAALDYARQIKHKQRDFLNKQGVAAIIE